MYPLFNNNENIDDRVYAKGLIYISGYVYPKITNQIL